MTYPGVHSIQREKETNWFFLFLLYSYIKSSRAILPTLWAKKKGGVKKTLVVYYITDEKERARTDFFFLQQRAILNRNAGPREDYQKTRALFSKSLRMEKGLKAK